MREKLLAIGDDFWIENDQRERADRLDGKAFRLQQTFVLEDATGDEVARIQQRKLSIRDKIVIERGGDTAATVHQPLVGIRDRFAIDVEHGADMKASRKRLRSRARDRARRRHGREHLQEMVSRTSSYGVDIAAGEGTPLILAIAVAIDSLTTETEATAPGLVEPVTGLRFIRCG
jgi:uncharacterized protein YxjI